MTSDAQTSGPAKAAPTVQTQSGQSAGKPSPLGGGWPMLPAWGEFNRLWEQMTGQALTMPRSPFDMTPLFDMSPMLRRMQSLGSVEVRTDIHETDAAYEIRCELPGIAEKDVELTVADGILTVRGSKEEEKKEGDGDYRLVERHFGSFRRSFPLPGGVDADAIKADFDKGVLTITVPKPAEAVPSARKIRIGAKAA